MQILPRFSSEPLLTRLFRAALLGAVAAACAPCIARSQTLTVPTSMPLAVQLVKHVPLKAGEPLETQLLYPVYVHNELAIPAGSRFEGTIVSLTPDRHRRIEARLEGDFTPFESPVVAFHQITLPDGRVYAISSESATDGAPILHLSAAAKPSRKKEFIRAQIANARQQVATDIGVIAKPGRGDRMLQFLYRQLPYHPQRIETGTAWTVKLASPLQVPAELDPPPPPAAAASRQKAPGLRGLLARAEAPDPELMKAHPGAELLHAYLTTTISSATAKPGDTFRARVVQPVYDGHHQLAVPEGAILIGTVTQAKPAKSFGRKGQLRFSFRELQMPGGTQQNVDGMLAGADASKAANLQIDAEGGVQPKQKSAIVPLALSVLATKGLDTDGSVASQTANGTVASNGFGIVGRIAGILAAPRGVGAGIGFYGAGLSVFNRWIAPGTNVTFVKDTRIDVLTTPARSRLSAAVQVPHSERGAVTAH
jgi:hypothetical protein